MDAGPDDVRPSTLNGASLAATLEELGPISPELVLVDPVLAEQARKLLPATPEPWQLRPPVATEPQPPVPLPDRAEGSTEPEPWPRRRRLRRTVVLSLLVFTAGAASGGFLERQDAGVIGPTLQRATPTTAAPAKRSTPQRKRHAHAARRAAPRIHKAARKPDHRRRRSALRQQRGSEIKWAANVLGVLARVDRLGVTLRWQRPKNSSRVVVLRAVGRRSGSIVFRGRATHFRDRAARPCTAYRYTIVNYDRRGHRSTGVPSSVVTEGCT